MTGIHQALAAGAGAGPSLYRIIQDNGLTSSLNLVLDAGDKRSVSSLSQTRWLDASGNGNDYYLGTSDAVTSSDPNFTGNIGQFGSAYFAFPTSPGTVQLFEEVPDHAYTNNWVKAGGAFTIVLIFYAAAVRTDNTAMVEIGDLGRLSPSSHTGVEIFLLSNFGLRFYRSWAPLTGTGSQTDLLSMGGVVGGAWNFVAATWNDATATASLRVNFSTNSLGGRPQSQITQNPTAPNRMGYSGWQPGEYFMPTDRLAATAHWSRQLSSAELDDLYNATKPYFSGMP